MIPSIEITGCILVVLLVMSLTYTVSAVPAPDSVTIVVKDAQTSDSLNSALVYLDGGYRGVTSTSDVSGKYVIQNVSPGKHTVRVTKTGYKEVTKKVVYPDESMVEIYLSKGFLVSLNENGTHSNAINIVFYPSSTSYSCPNHAKVAVTTYMANETLFREDVMKVISQTYLKLDQGISSPGALPADYQNRFNFYYYFDPASPGDAFSGCAGTVPEKYWNDVTFSDVTVILYPNYFGIYSDPTCQPTGCSQDFGQGRNVMKSPTNQISLFKHETGHAIFDLVDTYCGTTYYYENDPYANVWASLDACRAAAQSNNRDPDSCQQIATTSCEKNFWHSDPMPDIMAYGYGGKFGPASLQRINYVLTMSGA
jgi:hypothetical protein